MESGEGWQVELDRHKEGRKVYYRYADPSFSISNMPLNEMEINQLKSAFDILSQFQGMPQFGWINELIPKLQLGIASEERPDAIFEFDNNSYLKGIERLGELYQAIYYRKVLIVEYQPYENDTPFTLTIHPYFLKQYNNRWFVFGLNPEKEKYDWNLAIDRIVTIHESQEDDYITNSFIDWEEYFEDIIGVTKPVDGRVEKVVLRFLGKTAKYMVTKPIHGSQRSKWLDGETLEVTLSVMLNYELERLILSYADSVIVDQPASLAGNIEQRLSNAALQYAQMTH